MCAGTHGMAACCRMKVDLSTDGCARAQYEAAQGTPTRTAMDSKQLMQRQGLH